MQIVLKRAYDTPSPDDGYRVLVDRLWPRGVKKEDLQLDEWCKDVAPSPQLRVWFNHEPAKFDEFRVRYMSELGASAVPHALLKRAKSSKITLIYAAKDPAVNHAIVLKQFLETL